MRNLTLPKSVEVCGVTYEIRWDWRAALEIFAALCDADLSDAERAYVALTIFYPGFDEMPEEHYAEAINACMIFLNNGEEERDAKPKPKVMDWEQDFPLIVGPVSRIIGNDVRGMDNLHWWSFLAAYMEIGECMFAQVVSIRKKIAERKKLSKEDRAYYREYKDIIDIHRQYTEEENSIVNEWIGK